MLFRSPRWIWTGAIVACATDREGQLISALLRTWHSHHHGLFDRPTNSHRTQGLIEPRNILAIQKHQHVRLARLRILHNRRRQIHEDRACVLELRRINIWQNLDNSLLCAKVWVYIHHQVLGGVRVAAWRREKSACSQIASKAKVDGTQVILPHQQSDSHNRDLDGAIAPVRGIDCKLPRPQIASCVVHYGIWVGEQIRSVVGIFINRNPIEIAYHQ